MSQRLFSGRSAIAVLGLTLSLLTLSSAPAFADYRAWYSPWDYVGDFQSGDVSEDFTEMLPPASACGFRITTPSYYRWTDDEDGTIADGNLSKDVIIWIDNPGCSRSFSTRYYDDSHTFSPPGGVGVSIEISTNYSAYWVNDNGYYLYTCNGCVGPDDEVAVPPEDIWAHLVITGFKAVGGAVGDPKRQSRAAAAVAVISRKAADLQPLLQARIAERRRTPLSVLEASVRALEDAAVRALASALTAGKECEALTSSGHYAEAFKACASATRSVEHSDALMQTAWFLPRPPARPAAAAR
jgi:hypothetical protein